jgi:hypothetical protein
MLLSWYSFNLIRFRLPELVIISNHDTRQRKYGGIDLNAHGVTWASNLRKREECRGHTYRDHICKQLINVYTIMIEQENDLLTDDSSLNSCHVYTNNLFNRTGIMV